jgi:uridine kinase
MASTVIGVAGGSGSGKTTVAARVIEALGPTRACVIQCDRYYREHPSLTFEERSALNFDHPGALDMALLVEHVGALKAGRAIDAPVYDFSLHARRTECDRLTPHDAVIVEGILALADDALRDLLDLKIFVDTDADVRFIRRLSRDMHERGRTPQSVIDQYVSTVRPMHLAFVEPTKRYADMIVAEGGYNDVAIETLLARIGGLVRK